MAWLETIVLLAAIIGLGYWRTPLWLCGVVSTLLLAYLTRYGHISLLIILPIWFIFLGLIFFTAIKPIRRRYITIPLIKHVQKDMPSISATEREAIEAGDVWWEKALFCGQPDWHTLLKMPAPRLTTAEQAFLDNQVNTLCGMLQDWHIVQQGDLPTEVWNYLKRERFFALEIPVEFGGLGFSAQAHSAVITRIATRSISTAVSTMVPNSLGPAELLLHYGTDAQKNYYLPRLASGEDIPCFALTSPTAGSDAGAITDSGVVCRGEFNGQEIIGIRLNWDKRYITLAPIATLIGLAFRLSDPENLLGKGQEPGITLCLVPHQHPGVQSGRRHIPLNMAFMNGPVRGKDVFVPLDWVIGGADRIGQGWHMLMECLSVGRGISLPAMSAACGQLTYRMTGAYARIRKQFNVAIAHFEGVEEALGEIAGRTYLLEACRVFTVNAIDSGIKPAIATAITKYHTTEMSRIVMAHAMDIHGGHGIQMGPNNLLAQGHIAQPISITVEGANILTRNLIIFGQGAIRCHPYLLKEIELFAQPDSAEKYIQLDEILFSHVGYFINCTMRTLCYGLTGGRFIRSPVSGKVAHYYRQLTRMSSALALLSDLTLMLLGGDLKRRERISARLGDILSQLYLASAALKYFQDQGEQASDLDTLCWSLDLCLSEIQIAYDDLCNNFPLRWLGRLLRWMTFPLGTAYRKPRDKLTHRIARTMLEPSNFRDRLTHLFYQSKKSDDAAARLEKVFCQMPDMEPLLKKLRQGDKSKQNFTAQVHAAVKKNIITSAEADKLLSFQKAYNEVIGVDEFSFDLSQLLTDIPFALQDANAILD